MVVGCVKWFNAEKGFGFITQTDPPGPDVFVHYSAIQGSGYRELFDGETVVFEIEQGERGRQASQVARCSEPQLGS